MQQRKGLHLRPGCPSPVCRWLVGIAEVVGAPWPPVRKCRDVPDSTHGSRDRMGARRTRARDATRCSTRGVSPGRRKPSSSQRRACVCKAASFRTSEHGDQGVGPAPREGWTGDRILDAAARLRGTRDTVAVGNPGGFRKRPSLGGFESKGPWDSVRGSRKRHTRGKRAQRCFAGTRDPERDQVRNDTKKPLSFSTLTVGEATPRPPMTTTHPAVQTPRLRQDRSVAGQ